MTKKKENLLQLLTFQCWLESHNLQLRQELLAASALQVRENETVRENVKLKVKFT